MFFHCLFQVKSKEETAAAIAAGVNVINKFFSLKRYQNYLK